MMSEAFFVSFEKSIAHFMTRLPTLFFLQFLLNAQILLILRQVEDDNQGKTKKSR